MKKIVLVLVCFSLLTLAFVSCDPPAPPTYMVLTGGNYNDGTDTKPCYWSDTTRNVYSIIGAGEVNDITYDQNTIYACGYTVVSAAESACYWVGAGTRHDLPGDGVAGHPSNAYAIAVFGTSVYTVGAYSDGSKTIPCYWVDTTKYDLDAGSTGNGVATDFVVDNGTLYISGYYTGATEITACYWHGSGTGFVRTDLAADAVDHRSWGYSIDEENGTVYVGGMYKDAVNNNTPCYWANGVLTTLPMGGTNGGQVKAITVSNSTVYTVGFYSSGLSLTPCYWTGTSRTDLPMSGTSGSANGIYVVNGTPYIAGAVTTGGVTSACYWTVAATGTSKTDLPGSGTYNAYGSAIWLVAK